MECKLWVLLMLFGFCVSYGYDENSIKLKSPTTAVWFSLGSTVLPSVTLLVCAPMGGVHGSMGPVCVGSCVAGVIVGPSVGHFYAGDYMRGFASAGLRTGIAGLGFLGVAGTYSSDIEGAIICTVIGGATCIAVLASGIYDIWTCPDAVQKYNESVRNHGGLYLTPEIDFSHKSYGIRLVYNF